MARSSSSEELSAHLILLIPKDNKLPKNGDLLSFSLQSKAKFLEKQERPGQCLE